jgi:hypothetical protein
MAQKFIILDAGRLKQLEALLTSAGAGDSGKIPALGADGRLSLTFMPTGVGPDTLTVTASENLSAGDLINLWNDAGTLKMRKADASTEGKEVDGFVKDAVVADAQGIAYFDGSITGLAGLTLGSRYYLSAAAPGGIVTAPPSAAGQVVQYVGKASSATELVFEAGPPVTLA